MKTPELVLLTPLFPISRDPPEGGTLFLGRLVSHCLKFPISRDPPEGGTLKVADGYLLYLEFPISRDPPEGGTFNLSPPSPS